MPNRPTTGDGEATSVCEAESVTKDKRHDPLALPHRQQQRVAPMNFLLFLPALLMDRDACDIHTTHTHTHMCRACPFVELDFSSMKWVSASTVIQLFNPYTLLHLNLSNCTQI